MPIPRPTVRLAPGAQQWLKAYTLARPRWDDVETTGYPVVRTASGADPADVVDLRPSSAPSPSGPAPAGPDPVMWQVIREVRQASAARLLRTRTDIVAAVVDATGVAPTRVAAAIAYWAEHPDEVTARLHS